MKLKKYIGILLGACTLALFAGCYEPLDLTDSEMDMVAEYAAGVLVKHGTKATDTLLDRQEQDAAFAAMATPTPRPTLAPTTDETEQDAVGGDDETEAPAATKKPTPTAVPENSDLTMQDLTNLIGKKDFFFRYNGYETTSLYQGTGNMFAAAEGGKQLVVLEFAVTNEADTDATLVLNKGASKEFVYTLRAGSKTIRPSLTLLEEDFYTSYEVNYKAGETKTCVLVFECDEEIIDKSMTLTVLRDVKGSEDSVLLKVK